MRNLYLVIDSDTNGAEFGIKEIFLNAKRAEAFIREELTCYASRGLDCVMIYKFKRDRDLEDLIKTTKKSRLVSAIVDYLEEHNLETDLSCYEFKSFYKEA